LTIGAAHAAERSLDNRFMTSTSSANNKPRHDGIGFVLLALLPIAGFCVILTTWAVRGIPIAAGRRSAIVGTRPADGERAVLPSAFIAADLHLPHRGHGVDSRTISEKTVHLIRADDGQRVPAVVNSRPGRRWRSAPPTPLK
jgi:hypothetical protein